MTTEKIRPLPGKLWTRKYTPGGKHKLKLDGRVWQGEMRDSGLFIPSTKSDAENDVLAKLYVVETVGKDTEEGWRTKWFLKDPTDENEKSWRYYPTTFAKQGVSEGVVVAASAKAGMTSATGLEGENTQLQQDEVVAIGKPLDAAYDKDEFSMFAAPGWVIVKLLGQDDNTTSKGGIIIPKGQIATREEQGSAQWGRIVEVPQGCTYEELGNLCVGLRVSMPYALHVGDYALEWVDFEGGFRAIPLMCLLAVIYEAEPEDIDEACHRGWDDCTEQMQWPEKGLVYMNPYEPQSTAWAGYDWQFFEASCK